MEYLAEYFYFWPLTTVSYGDEICTFDNDEDALEYFHHKYDDHLLSVTETNGRHIFVN